MQHYKIIRFQCIIVLNLSALAHRSSRLWSYQDWPSSGRTSFDLVTVQSAIMGETPVNYTPYPNSSSYDPDDPPVWGWHNPYAVPIPSAVWLLGSGLIGIVGIRRKIKN